MEISSGTVFLVDVDDTLFDNDRFESDLKNFLKERFGTKGRDRYTEIFEELRAEVGYADFLGATQRFRIDQDQSIQTMPLAFFLRDYPFSSNVYPNAFEVLNHLDTLGTTIILSDGDAFFQPHKIDRSGIRNAVKDRIRIYVHKEKMLEQIQEEFPASHYCMIDDKIRILSSMKQSWKDRLTTVFVRQGHYARNSEITAQYPDPDLGIDQIGDLLRQQKFPFGKSDFTL
ncbi:MAG: HAD family hydrolase [Leptospirales bacterium]